MGRAEDLFKLAEGDGEAFINDLIANGTSEELFIDYKRSSGNGSGTKLAQDDRKNLAKAISGFGNSEGGIVIWGVNCKYDPQRGDIPSGPVPIENPNRFGSWIEGALSGCTLPAHGQVKNIVILSTTDPDSGFVVTLVPASPFAPLSTVVSGEQSEFYMRAGSSFVRVPHAVLAGMFGRRPNPKLAHGFVHYQGDRDIYAKLLEKTEFGRALLIGVTIINTGPVMARELYLNIQFQVPGDSWQAKVVQIGERWTEFRPADGNAHYMVATDSLKLAPSAQCEVCKFALTGHKVTNTLFHKELSIEITYGCDGSPTQKFRSSILPDMAGALFAGFESSGFSAAAASDFARAILEENSGSE